MEATLLMSLGFAVSVKHDRGRVLAEGSHKKTVIIFDTILWPVAVLIFAFGQHIWWFVAGDNQ